ncbi:hypothetical protein BC938DRAFT_477097, partial [Jimgerdemannia flammicorona]
MNSYKPIEVSQKQRLCGRFTRRQCYIIIGVPVILLSITGIVLLALHLSGTIGYQNHNSASITDMSADDLLSCGNLDPFGDASKMTTYSFDPKLTKAFLFNVVGQGAVTGRIKIFQSATDDPTGMQPANLTVRLVSTDPLARIDGGQDGINFNLQVQSKETFIPPSMFTTSSSSSVIPTSSAGVNATRAANATGPVMPYGCSRFDIELVLPRITTMSVWNFTAPDARVELVASFVNVNGTGKIVVTDRVVVQMLAGDVTMNVGIGSLFRICCFAFVPECGDIIAPTVKIEIKNGTILGIFHDVRNFTTSTQNGDVDVNLRGNYLAQANITASTGNGNVTVRL